MITSKTKEASDKNTIWSLNFLADRGYKISKKRAQISQSNAKYFRFELSQGQRILLLDQREALERVVIPTTQRQLQGFLGMAGFFCDWIPNVGLIAKPLYETLKGRESDPLDWAGECQKAYFTIKERLLMVPDGSPRAQKTLRPPLQK